AQVKAKAPLLRAALERVAAHPRVTRVRTIGMLGAADLRTTSQGAGGYLDPVGWRMYEEALRRGAYLRPLGNTVYVAPPLTIVLQDLEQLLEIFERSIAVALGT